MPSAETDPLRLSFAPRSARSAERKPVLRGRLMASVAFTVTLAAAGAALAQDVREEDKTSRVLASNEQATEGVTTLETSSRLAAIVRTRWTFRWPSPS
jgi:iron complex outermembrane recepter protein